MPCNTSSRYAVLRPTSDGTKSPMNRDLTQQTCVLAQLSTTKGIPSERKEMVGRLLSVSELTLVVKILYSESEYDLHLR